ncbi:MAG: GumC family protein, partial [Janthinobacterium lividum]
AQLQSKSRQLDQDQAALTAFEVQHGIADLDDQKKLQVTRISALQDQLAQAEATLAAQRSKALTQERELSTTPARSRTQERTITNQYSQERLNTSLVDLENHRTELLKRYMPSDRQVVEIDDKIVTTRKAMADAGTHPAGESATDINPVWQQLSVAVATSGGEISGLDGQRLTLKVQVAAAQNRLEELEEATSAYAALRRKVQQSQADYTLYAQRRDEARISEALDREKLFNVGVLQRPLASPQPVRPKPVLYTAVGLVFSFFFGIALALYADLSGGQVHSPAQLEALTGTRTLATFAGEEPGKDSSESNRLQYRRVLMSIRQSVAALRPLWTEAPMAALATVGGGSWSPEELEELNSDLRGSCVAFTSALRGEGVTFLANHLATEAARQTSSRVAVLDMPVLLHRFETHGEVSLVTRFDDSKEHWVLALDEEPQTWSAMPVRAAQGQLSSRLRPLLKQARSEFDLLILDCPSLQASTLAAELAPCVDGFVAVVRANTSRKQNIEDLISQLTSTNAPVLGYLLNGRHYPVPKWLYRLMW